MNEMFLGYVIASMSMVLGYWMGRARSNMEIQAVMDAIQHTRRVPRRDMLSVGPTPADLDDEDDHGPSKVLMALTNPLIWILSAFLWFVLIWAGVKVWEGL